MIVRKALALRRYRSVVLQFTIAQRAVAREMPRMVTQEIQYIQIYMSILSSADTCAVCCHSRIDQRFFSLISLPSRGFPSPHGLPAIATVAKKLGGFLRIVERRMGLVWMESNTRFLTSAGKHRLPVA